MINLGDKKWGVKDSGLLAYKQVGSKFFNKDFDFTRASSATRVNKQGLIETVASGVPRIDFTDANGALLLEPQRTNLLTYSEAFDNASWVKLGQGTGSVPIVTPNYAISPDGTQNASRLQCDLNGGNTTNDRSWLYQSITDVVVENTFSLYVKNISSETIIFTLNNGSSGTVSVSPDSQWHRLYSVKTGGAQPRIGLIGGVGASDNADLLIWGSQLELGSYATSYIPTYGSAQTRLGETCNNSGSAQDFNSEEGVLYAEIAALVEVDNARRFITLNDGTSSNGVVLRYEASGEIVARYQIGGVAQCSIDFATTITNSHKIAFKYSLNDFALWVDGVEVGVDNSGNVLAANTINNIDFNSGNGTFPFYGKARSVKYFPTALGDSKLITLTGGDGSLYGLFNSFKARVLADGGTIESQDCIINELKELL
jgi:hypothetical protein